MFIMFKPKLYAFIFPSKEIITNSGDNNVEIMSCQSSVNSQLTPFAALDVINMNWF